MLSFLPDILSSKSPPPVISPQLQRGYSKTFVRDEDEKGASSPIGMTESIACNRLTFASLIFCRCKSLSFIMCSLYFNQVQTFFAAEGYIRGRSYNIKLDDQVLLRFSPKKSDSNYYFSDMVNSLESIVRYEICIHTQN